LEYGRFAGSISTNERRDVALQINFVFCRTEAAEILDGNVVDLHCLTSVLTDILEPLASSI
jgi:hypothetical protein